MGKAIYDAKKDPMYSKPYIDMDEERERVLPDGTRLPYRYMHGGFQNTNLKFSFCFPPKEIMASFSPAVVVSKFVMLYSVGESSRELFA